MQASLRLYVDLLGFKNASWGTDDFTCVSRGGACIYLSGTYVLLLLQGDRLLKAQSLMIDFQADLPLRSSMWSSRRLKLEVRAQRQYHNSAQGLIAAAPTPSKSFVLGQNIRID